MTIHKKATHGLVFLIIAVRTRSLAGAHWQEAGNCYLERKGYIRGGV